MAITTTAVRYHETGGPEVLRVEEVEVPEPGPGQALVRHAAIGVNYRDIYYRIGDIPAGLPAELPAVLGVEGAGVVEAVGPDTQGVKPGDRVSYCMILGSYAELMVIDARHLVAVPDSVSDEQAGGATLRGLTAHYLINSTYAVQPDDTILVHAAAGGMGLLLCQWAKHIGATVIGTVGSDAKAKLAQAHGCDHPIVYTREDFVPRVKEITDGQGVPVVYDAVGQATFDGSLECLQRLGKLAFYGTASGMPAPLDLNRLTAKGIWVTRTGLVNHIVTREELESRAADFFGLVVDGAIKIQIGQRYPLAEAAQAQRDLEERRTTGSSILLP